MSKATQELGETRTAMGRHVMNSLEKIINENKKFGDRYFVIFYIKPFSACPEVIRNRIILSKVKPPKMLSTIVFEVDNIQDYSGPQKLDHLLSYSHAKVFVGG